MFLWGNIKVSSCNIFKLIINLYVNNFIVFIVVEKMELLNNGIILKCVKFIVYLNLI